MSNNLGKIISIKEITGFKCGNFGMMDGTNGSRMSLLSAKSSLKKASGATILHRIKPGNRQM